jgi:hypothetical protein
MKVDDSRHHKLAGEIDNVRAGWRLELRRWTDPRDAARIDDHRGIGDRRTTGPVDQREALENFYFGVKAVRGQEQRQQREKKFFFAEASFCIAGVAPVSDR